VPLAHSLLKPSRGVTQDHLADTGSPMMSHERNIRDKVEIDDRCPRGRVEASLETPRMEKPRR